MTRIMFSLLTLSIVVASAGCQKQQQSVQMGQQPESAAVTGDTIAWPEAVKMIQDGKITMVVQYHSLDAILTTADGKQFKTKQPKIDAAKHLVEEVDPTGKKIVYGTE